VTTVGGVKTGTTRRASQPPGRAADRVTDRSGDRAALATRLVDEAGRILSAEGASALTLRRLATATGTSTMAVYTLFGDKQGLLAAMYREGFARLGAASEAAAASSPDPLTALANLGLAYRANALASPHLYDLMFGRPVATFTPDEETEALAESTYRPLVDAVQRCLDTGAMVDATGQTDAGSAERIAWYLWAVTHGFVSLELAGHLGIEPADRDAAYVDALVISSMPFLPKA
jgi:AcrR family transcriptional regulator